MRRRTLAASLLPTFAIALSWLRIEEPARVGEALVVVALALAPALVPPGWPRWLAVAGAAMGASWIAFAAKSWELLPFRDERVLVPLGDEIGVGIADFYRVVLPFQPGANPGMHGLMLAAIFAFVIAVSLLAAAPRPVGAAAVTVVGVGWPATLVDGGSVAIGALALAAALSIPLVLRVRSGRALAAGVVATALVVLRRGLGIGGDDDRPRGRSRLGELGSVRRVGARDGRQVRLGLELRGHQLPAHEDGRADREGARELRRTGAPRRSTTSPRTTGSRTRP